jgi:beta-aspartyl-peptidase (threonine type)
MPNVSPVLVVHAGAGPISLEHYARNRPGVGEAIAKVAPILQAGAPALEAVELTVRLLEEDPRFNAGVGSSLRLDGSIRFDATIMDGSTLRGAGIAFARGVQYPVTLARMLLERTEFVLLAGEDVNQFALDCGLELLPDEYFITEERRQLWERKKVAGETPADQVVNSGGTVGATALDINGRLAAATSTGGLVLSPQGRIGDSAILGAGTFANEFAAVSCTGVGESIMRVAMARYCVDLVEQGRSAQEAAEVAIKLQHDRTPGTSGLVALDAKGGIGIAYNSRAMYRGYWNEKEGVVVPE